MMGRWIGIATVLGAASGAVSAIRDSIGLMIIMGVIGAAFGCGIGSGLGALVSVLTSKRIPHISRTGSKNDSFEADICTQFTEQMQMAQKRADEMKGQFPIAGDPDPIAKSITGWHDATDISLNRDIH